MLLKLEGVIVRRVIDRSHACIPAHSHDWPLLSLFVLGGYRNHTEVGEQQIDGPSAVFYRAGSAHRNLASSNGFEQVEIEFDPAWLGPSALPETPVAHWIGGAAGREARCLARICCTASSAETLRGAIRQFLFNSKGESSRRRASWVAVVRRRLEDDPSLRVADLAREIGRHPSWLGSAYHYTTGEGVLESAARFRVERACRLLRESALSLAHIAAEAGFCDQSHMNRIFRRMLGRTPSAVREDRFLLRRPAVEG
jgi:AraC family transcriptional regulator